MAHAQVGLWLGVLWFAATPARAEEPATCFAISASAAEAVAASGKSVRIQIRAHAGPVGETPVVWATAGELSPPQPVSQGLFQMTYRPPWRPEPELVLIVADLPRGPCRPSLLILPVVADQTVTAQVEPNARVTLRVGPESFGPARADASGQVALRARLHPTWSEPELEVAAPGAKVRRVPLKLSLRPRPRLLMHLKPAAVRADGQASASVYLLGANAEGGPLGRLEADLLAGGARLPFERRVAGVFEAVYRPNRSATEGSISLEADIRTPVQRSLQAHLGILPGVALVLELAADPPRLRADGQSRALVTVAVRDESGQGVAGLPIELSTSLGRLGPVSDLGSGRYQAELVAPDSRGADTAAAVSAAVGAERVKVVLPLDRPPPLTARTSAALLQADGESTCKVEVRHFPAEGEPVASEIAIEAQGGLAPKTAPLVDGRATFAFRAGSQAGPGSVAVRVGPHESRLALELVPGKPAALSLQVSRAEVESDGTSQVEVTALVRDACGNLIPEPALALTASAGQLRETRIVAVGTVTATYLPPEGQGGEVLLRAAGGEGLRAEVRLKLRPPTPDFGIALAAGIQHDLVHGAPFLGLAVERRIGWGFFGVLGIGYYVKEFDSRCGETCSGSLTSLRGQLRQDTLPLGLGVDYRFESGTRLTPGLGLDGLLVWSRSEFTANGQRLLSQSTVGLGIRARARLEVGLGPGGVFLDIGTLFAPWTGAEVFSGQSGGLLAVLGYRLGL